MTEADNQINRAQVIFDALHGTLAQMNDPPSLDDVAIAFCWGLGHCLAQYSPASREDVSAKMVGIIRQSIAAHEEATAQMKERLN